MCWLFRLALPAEIWWCKSEVLILSILLIASTHRAQAQSNNPPEISTHDADATFTLKTERNIVLVPVVVRNAKGQPIDNLRKEDFRIFDRGKPQTILSFATEKPSASATPEGQENPGPKAEKLSTGDSSTGMPQNSAQRYVALFFDDINSSEADLAHTREAATRYLGTSVQPSDRIGLFTASGQKHADFTSDVASIQRALTKLHPRQDTSINVIPPYIAYLALEQSDRSAMALLICGPNETPDNCAQTEPQARAEASAALNYSDSLSLSVLRGMDGLVRNMSSLPGERTLVIVSSGFQTYSTSFLSQIDKIVDTAVRAHVVINAINARGVYGDLSITNLDESQPQSQDRLLTKLMVVNPLLKDGERRRTEAMKAFPHDTGGVVFENSNDFDAGMRQTTGVPEALYLLTFSPQNLKHDGAFHDLKIALVSSHGLTLQARHGYFAPPKSEDLAAQEKEEIRDAVFSLDESHTLPVEVHTQFFMTSETDARVTVITHIDLRSLRFRKDAGRNFDKLTLVTVLFDQDGHEVDAQNKVLEFQTHDAVLEKYLESGITLNGRFNVKPGRYRVRTDLRESESDSRPV